MKAPPTLIAAALAALSGAGPVAWGPAANGLRLGIRFGSTASQPVLCVLLHNTGRTPLHIVIGRKVGKGIAPEFRFFASSPEGKRREGFEINSYTPVEGLVLPAIMRLDPGATHELRYALNKIICTERPGDVTFDSLVKQRYSLRVSLEGDANSAEWLRVSPGWTGKLNSGELPPHAHGAPSASTTAIH